jgi:uncharacterized protein YndB with AHSA1/START domain
MSKRSTDHATFTIERTYPTSPARVFGAWAEQDAKAVWFGPKLASGEGYELDFRIGGAERLSVGTPDGATYRYEAHYQDIVPDERIVYTYEMYRNDDRISVSVATIEIRPAEGATVLSFTEQGVFLDGHDTAAEREHGTGELLVALGEALLQGVAG